ncbi:hypothetical protein [Denitrobaculum tricleocarpae]|uniref:Uncharacterized protein n=1 Tax=Denitrobaculum tricleocarpae TaxID=2591009 RepID=A0A545TME9_9PROT|nr:hypothetical protein [Denitrobaculum tricleocarpae]TQV78348.1 hypothetical protein FKG95_17425 [Denitrobaculum tricleocarpae]
MGDYAFNHTSLLLDLCAAVRGTTKEHGVKLSDDGGELMRVLDNYLAFANDEGFIDSADQLKRTGS